MGVLVEVLGFFGDLDVETFEDPGGDCIGDVVGCVVSCGGESIVIGVRGFQDVEVGCDIRDNPLGFFKSIVDFVDGFVEGFDVDVGGIGVDRGVEIVVEFENNVVYFAPYRKLVDTFHHKQDGTVVSEVQYCPDGLTKGANPFGFDLIEIEHPNEVDDKNPTDYQPNDITAKGTIDTDSSYG